MGDDELRRANEALADALTMPEGPERQAALEAATNRRQEVGPGSEQLTNALTQLQRWEEAEESLVDECTDHIHHRVKSPMMLGAWGLHLVKMFERFGDERYKAFARFAERAYEREGAEAKILHRALRHASPGDPELRELRDHFIPSLDNALLLWRARRAGYEDPEY